MNMDISQITTRHVKFLTCFQILRQAIAYTCGDAKQKTKNVQTKNEHQQSIQFFNHHF